MERSREAVLEWESRWLVPAGIASLIGAVALIASSFVIGSVSGDGEAELLNSVDEHSSSVILSAVLQAAGFLLLVLPLYVLFRATAARSTQMRVQLIGLVIAAPLFFAVSSVFNAVASSDAADQFVSGQANSTLSPREAAADCREELRDLGAEDFRDEFEEAGKPPRQVCEQTAVEDEAAENAIDEASTRGLATGFGLGGRLGLAIALLYTCLHAMRVGLLSRFWGALGMALGVAALLLLVQFTLILFIYLGILFLGKVPGGRPPAWAAGEAIPWPSPGEQAAERMQASEPANPAELDPADRRKRKQRDSDQRDADRGDESG